VPKTKDGRVVFLLPWLGAAIAGTTDAPAALTMTPRATCAEVDFILDALSDYVCVAPRRADVLSAWSGLRPLASDASKGATENITRDHVLTAEAGMLTITGGKWTTYRKARGRVGAWARGRVT
jgi:glycerol-3-phosphate dehydrogenase